MKIARAKQRGGGGEPGDKTRKFVIESDHFTCKADKIKNIHVLHEHKSECTRLWHIES